MMHAQREEEKESDGARAGRGQEGERWSVERRERGRDETLAGGGREGACKEWDERGEKERWEAVRHRERGEAMGNGWCTCI